MMRLSKRSLLNVMVFSLLLGWGTLIHSQNSLDRTMGSFSDQLQAESDSLNGLQNSSLDLNDSVLAVDSALLVDEALAPRYVERNYNHKEQVITGGVIMLCIGLILVTSNNFNPKQ